MFSDGAKERDQIGLGKGNLQEGDEVREGRRGREVF